MIIKKIIDVCVPCAIYERVPKRFKMTVGTDTLKFNGSDQVDTMFINSKPVLDMVYLATYLSTVA